MLFGWQEE
jgi:lipid A disaccharide synthetase